MATQAGNTGTKKKAASAAAAVAVAAALALGGTFAWQSISQMALNEASDVVNPGGRLHDDFNGSNKDVYVENFTDVETGEDIFARIRLEEYFEIVMNQGTPAAKTEVVIGERVAKEDEAGDPVVDDDGNRVYENRGATFTGYSSDGAVDAAVDEDGTSWWSWTTGGETVYMPTFNKNKDSLAADVNGTYLGEDGVVTDASDDDRYGDYREYASGETVAGTEVYDADSNDLEDDGVTEVDNVEHTAKPTLGATLMSMQEWIDAGSPVGEYWVYDTDGWVYWADAIEPGTATGLLLDGIELKGVMDDSWYYAINVVAQFVTADDSGKIDGTGFYDVSEGLPAPSSDAETLLRTIGVSIPSTSLFAVSPVSHAVSQDGGITAYAGEEIVFEVTDHEGDVVTSAERLTELGVTSAFQADGSIIGAYTFTLNEDGTVTGQLPDNNNEAYSGSVTVSMTNPGTGELEQVVLPLVAQQDNRPTYTVKDPNYGTVFAQDIKPGASFDIFPGSYVSLSSSDSSTTWSDSSELSSVYGSPYGGVSFSVSGEELVGTVITLTHTASDGRDYAIYANVVEQPASLTFNSKKFYETTENSVQCNQGGRYYYTTQNFDGEVTLTLYDENNEVVSDAVDGSSFALPTGYDTSYTLVATDGTSTVNVSIGIRDEYKLYLNGKSDYGWGEYVLRGETRTFSVYKNGNVHEDLASELTWTINRETTDPDTKVENGVLTIGANETTTEFTLYAEGESFSVSLSIYVADKVLTPVSETSTLVEVTVPDAAAKYVVLLDVFNFGDDVSVNSIDAERTSNGPNGLTNKEATYDGKAVLTLHVDPNNVSSDDVGIFTFSKPQTDIKLRVVIE